MKQDFLNFLNKLMEASPEVVKQEMTEDIKAYIAAISETNDKPAITDNGKIILKYMQDSIDPTFKAREIAEGLNVTSRQVSGSLRKLVNDGFAEKIGNNPVIYTLTEKGKNYNINVD